MKFLLLSLLSVYLFMSCSKNNNPLIEVDRETFEKEHIAWDVQNIKNYIFTYEYSSNSMPFYGLVKITIQEGHEPIIEHSYDYIENIPYTSIAGIYEQLNNLFDDMEKIKKRTYSHYTVESAILRIEYDTQYHYPKKISHVVVLTDKGIPIPGNPSIKMEITSFLSF